MFFFFANNLIRFPICKFDWIRFWSVYLHILLRLKYSSEYYISHMYVKSVGQIDSVYSWNTNIVSPALTLFVQKCPEDMEVKLCRWNLWFSIYNNFYFSFSLPFRFFFLPRQFSLVRRTLNSFTFLIMILQTV